MSDSASDDMHWRLRDLEAILTMLLPRKGSAMLYSTLEASVLSKLALPEPK
jgi:hypothetical protein